MTAEEGAGVGGSLDGLLPADPDGELTSDTEDDGWVPRADRERDEQGRARNARPRDALGRPLTRGVTGDERVPENLVLPPQEALEQAQRLLDAGRPFHAHEILEGTWKAAPEPERDLWQGLAQLAVGLTHLLRGNPTGARTLLQRADRRLERYADDPPYGVDVRGLQEWTQTLLADLNSKSPSDLRAVPRLRSL